MAEDSEAPTPGFGQGAGLRRPCSSLEKAKARVEARTIVLLLEALAAVGGIEGGCGAAGGVPVVTTASGLPLAPAAGGVPIGADG